MEALAAWLPETVSTHLAAMLVIAAYFTSALTASVGIGGGIAMVAILGSTIPLAAVVPVHGVVQLGSNAGRAVIMREHLRMEKLWPFLIGVLFGVVLGSFFAVSLDERTFKIGLATFVIVLTWAKLPALTSLSDKASSRILFGGGLISMFLNMMFGATGPIVSTLFARVFDRRQQLIAAVAAAMTAQNLVKTMAFGALGFTFTPWVPLIAAMIVAGFAGTYTGAKLLNFLPEKSFRIIFRICLTLLALNMIRQGLAA